MVVAAATLTCCPRHARTADSKPSNAPGTRSPGRRRSDGARADPAQVRGDRDGLRVEVEERAQPRHERHEGAREGGGDLDAQRVGGRVGGHGDPARPCAPRRTVRR